MKRPAIRHLPVHVCLAVRSTTLLFLLAPSLWALNPALALHQFAHTTWTPRQGYNLAGIQAMAQTSDGYLWLGSNRGLTRFNGATFTRWKNAEDERIELGSAVALAAAAGGGLWVATKNELAQLQSNRVVRLPAGVTPPTGITSILEDHTGTLWLGGRAAGTLSRVRNGAVHTLDTAKWLPQAPVTALYEDRENGIWIGTERGICRWSADATPQCWLTQPGSEIEAVQGGSTGAIFVLDGRIHNVQAFSPGGWKPFIPNFAAETIPMKSLLVDRDNCLWIGTTGMGLIRICNGRTERFLQRDGLSGDLVLALYQDREGNIWAGTSNGLDRFREPKVARLSTAEGLSGNLCTAVNAVRDGSVWVGTASGGIDRVLHGEVTHLADPGASPGTVLSIFEDDSGTIWTGTTGGLKYHRHGQSGEVRSREEGPLNRIIALADDHHGTRWAADARLGLFQIRNGTGTRDNSIPRPADRNIFALFADHSSRLWIGYFQGGVTVAGPGLPTRTFLAGNGVAPGAVQTIQEDSQGSIWFGTTEGLSRFRNGKWTSWGPKETLTQGVQGIAFADPNDMWLATAGGLLRVNQAALSAMPDTSSAALQIQTYGPEDAVQFPESRRTVNPRLTRSSDGRIWISTDDGLAVVDPARFPSSPAAPPVLIEQVLLDGHPVQRVPSPAIRGRELEIQFTPLSLAPPESLEVRYRLEGLDTHWNFAKGPTRVVYSALRPGPYRFRVIAASPEGVWNYSGASLDFRWIPEFYQTWWFRLLCSAAVLAAAYGLHLTRMRILRAQVRVTLQERTRIARDLHDSLMQGFAGTVYLMQAGLIQLETTPATGRQRIESAIEQANRSLKEARQALTWLRLPALVDQNLVEALDEAGRKIVDGTSIRFSTEVSGKARQFPYKVEAELFIIGREAMTNAMAHGRPGQIRLHLAYASDQISLSVQDDGIGFDPQEGTAKANHWGLLGMRERADSVGGTLTVESRPSRGVLVHVVVPLSARGRGKDAPL